MDAGGYEYDGAEIAAVDEAEVCAAVRREWAAGVRSFVVAGVFSPVKSDQEDHVAQLVNAELARLAGVTAVHAAAHHARTFCFVPAGVSLQYDFTVACYGTVPYSHHCLMAVSSVCLRRRWRSQLQSFKSQAGRHVPAGGGFDGVIISRCACQAGGSKEPCYVTKSHEVAGMGLLERENAAALNATLRPLAAALIPAFRDALAALGFGGRLFLTSNDGTLLSAEAAEKVRVAGPARLTGIGLWGVTSHLACQQVHVWY